MDAKERDEEISRLEKLLERLRQQNEALKMRVEQELEQLRSDRDRPAPHKPRDAA